MKNNTTESELNAALASLNHEHKHNWLAFNEKINGVLNVLGQRMGCKWSANEDITEEISEDDFIAAGYTAAEANALVFVLTEDCMGQAVDSLDMVERWFCYCAPSISGTRL